MQKETFTSLWLGSRTSLRSTTLCSGIGLENQIKQLTLYQESSMMTIERQTRWTVFGLSRYDVTSLVEFRFGGASVNRVTVFDS